MPKVANPILKIQKAVEALKAKNAKLNSDIAVIEKMLVEAAKAPAPAAVKAVVKKAAGAKKPAAKSAAPKAAAPKPAAGDVVPKRRGRPPKAK
ncbi:MAG: hypothetical protein JXA15_00955 [Spirochaetales bacterium]|nr:hypothetical protein [Spirochaetales bacterium]